MRHQRFLFSCIIVLCGIAMTGISIFFLYFSGVKTLQEDEKFIVDEIGRVITTEFTDKMSSNQLSTTIAFLGNNVTREEFEFLSSPIVQASIGATSIGMVPRVFPSERSLFTAYAMSQFPERSYEIMSLAENLSIVPRPVDDETMWPMLYTNPLSERFIGFDFNLLWNNDIQKMILSNSTVLTSAFSMAGLGGIGSFVGEASVTFDETRENMVFMTFHPVFDALGSVVAFVGKLILPRGIIIDALGVLSQKTKNLRFSMFTSVAGVYRAIMDLDTGFDNPSTFLFEDTDARGKNNYASEYNFSDRTFVFVMSSDTLPPLTACFVVGVVGLVTTSVIWWIYLRQDRASVENVKLAKSSENANNMKTKFLAEMSHELRTPLNGIMGTIELLETCDVNEEVKDFICDIRSCSEILLLNISDILDLSKIESGNVVVMRDNIRVHDFVMSIGRIMCQSYKKPTSATDVEFRIQVDKSVPTSQLRGDSAKLRQCIMNLVSNAFKFTDSGNVTLRVSWLSDFLLVDVTDTGIGISPDGIDRLFKSYSQVHQGRSDAGGTGLGLVITKSLCEAMGGSLNCKSVVGEGTAFRATCRFSSHVDSICYNSIDTQSILSLQSHEARVTSSLSATNNVVTALVVDDAFINRKVTGNFLIKLGVNVDFAESGEDAVVHCRSKEYCIIFMDYFMPGIGGDVAASTILSEGLNVNTPIVALTGSNSDDILESIKKSGMVDVLLKPVSYDKIHEVYTTYVLDKGANVV